MCGGGGGTNFLQNDLRFCPLPRISPLTSINLISLRTAKILWSFGCFECNRVKTVFLLA